MITWTLRIPRRWFGVSIQPPVPIALPLVNDSSPASTAVDVASISWVIGILFATICAGSAWTWISLRFSPQIATLATPGTCSSRCLIVYCATVERSSGERVFDVSPICITRLVAETIGYSAGGDDHDGSVGAAAVSRSWTSCRAWRTSVPFLKYRKIADSCGTDSDSTS